MGLREGLSSIQPKGSAHRGISRLLRRSTILQISIIADSLPILELIRISTNLVFHVLQRIWSIHRESNQEDMGLRVSQWSQALIVFLSCCIPQSQLD